MENKGLLKQVYRQSLALLTDLYEMTMAYGYWKQGMDRRPAVFQLFFRKKPFGGSFAVCAGMQTAIEFIENFHFDESDLTYLASLKDGAGGQLFENKFLDMLKNMRMELDVDAIPEGTLVFPHEPMIRVQGPLLQAQIMESALLNILNFQTLVATKAARVCSAAKPDEVVEFGLRRAQGIDGAIAASRASYVGGCHSTSNVLAGKLFGIPVMGTHAHSWVMAFEDEKHSFSAFADAFPNSAIFLIDTYDSISGAHHAVEVGKELGQRGIELKGVRLDSGDLTVLSLEVRRILDEGGFPNAKIMASNELDERIIADLKHQGSKITLWGVGTNLVTARDMPALDGVYKLSAIQDEKGEWQYRLKVSDHVVKTTHPGISQVRRYFDEKGAVCDMLYDIHMSMPEEPVIIEHSDVSLTKKVKKNWKWQDLLIPMMRAGKRVYTFPPMAAMRQNTYAQLEQFDPAVRRFLNPTPFFSGTEKGLFDLKLKMIDKIHEDTSDR